MQVPTLQPLLPSHSSPSSGSVMLSPQRCSVQSVRQTASGLLLLLPPRSHCSLPSSWPSPQIGEQTLGVAVLQVQPLSTVHVALQPSAPVVSPSSHVSPPLRKPSPQIGAHTFGVAVLQLQPVSVAHRPSQPSPPLVSPSSHCSGAMRRPSPQIGVHTLGMFVLHV